MEAAQWQVLMTSVSISLDAVFNQTLISTIIIIIIIRRYQDLKGLHKTLSCGLSPATGLAGIHVVTQLLQFVILRQVSVVADLLEVSHALGLRKDMQAALLQLEASCLGRNWDGALLTWVVLKQLRQAGSQQALNLCLQGNLDVFCWWLFFLVFAFSVC